MKLSSQPVMQKLGAGQSIQAVCAAAGWTRPQFDAWWQAELTARLPDISTDRRLPVTADVEIVRDKWGIPHILANNNEDLFFGLGFAMAQDRLWQLDYFRRKAMGRLAEILGPEAVPQDILARTVGLHRIARQQVKQFPPETWQLLQAFSGGVNAVIEESRNQMPIEFGLLDYQPEPWTPLDCMAIWVDKRWYSSGRIPVIALPELAKRLLDNDRLYQAFLTPEADEESILPPGAYPARRLETTPVGQTAGDPEEGIGSNNWVIAGQHTATGLPLLASDPHNAFSSLADRYEFHLCGGSFNVTGATHLGIPAVIFGRNERLAWGLTNNICSQRDLYQEKTDPDQPGCFLFDGRWVPGRELVEEITVKGTATIRKIIRFSHNGPIVDDLLPTPLQPSSPISLRWLGAAVSDEITCLLTANRAASCDAFREALRGWLTPTWSYLFADADGQIGYQCTGRIPVRTQAERGYRPGWDPDHEWQGLIPFEGMPALRNPARGWICSANNRTAPEDYPYPLGGTWSSGHRARRIRAMIEQQGHFSGSVIASPTPVAGDEPAAPPPEFVKMHQDVVSLRAVEALPPLLAILAEIEDERLAQVRSYLKAWAGDMGPDQVAASIFELFFRRWTARVARERFEAAVAPLLAGLINGLSLQLLAEDRAGWFASTEARRSAILAALKEALDELEERLGPDMSGWQWGRLHTITLRHYLSGRGDLGHLLDQGGFPVGGNIVTVCNTGYDASYQVTSGANYRLIADLSPAAPGLWAINAAGQSGQPGSQHYCDQLPEWLAGRYHFIPLKQNLEAKSRFYLRPREDQADERRPRQC